MLQSPSHQTCQRILSFIARIISRQLNQMSQHRRTSLARAALDQFKPQELCQRQAFIPLKATPGLMAMQRSQVRFGEDYRIYQQNIDLDSFFREELKYDKVSDVCLLNDHFILVKMPQFQFQQPVKAPTTQSPPQTKSKLPRCFKCSRSSRVSPILEELEEKRPQKSCLKPWASRDMDEVEVFDSTTTITTIPSEASRNGLDDIETFESSTTITFPRNSSVRAPPESVIVEQPHLQPHPQPPPIPALLQLEAIHPAASAPVVQTPLLSRAPIHWFLWPFRRRLHSRPKSKPPLAAVHKTYFVRWSKPPDTIWQGYGVDRGEKEHKMGLRRCRSAVF
ncbi:uncharacterized protein LOC108163985 [Drosophila miranda]|uniref:uncharacterized protein LOC108163985 n=1 Tax=Drosophila miranda TaxID=7229 RepID=UPI0007E7D909|nr:uncharacterized protein LOC108163985 [Drosophila miranda]